jgi:hypothetical protein
MSNFFANGKGTANPLNQLGNREGIDRSLFQVCPSDYPELSIRTVK